MTAGRQFKRQGIEPFVLTIEDEQTGRKTHLTRRMLCTLLQQWPDARAAARAIPSTGAVLTLEADSDLRPGAR